MMIQTIIDLRKASLELHKMVEHGKAQAARPDADKICRLGDETIAQYEATAKAIDALTERFPDYKHYNG
jgi:hypothetical protein